MSLSQTSSFQFLDKNCAKSIQSTLFDFQTQFRIIMNDFWLQYMFAFGCKLLSFSVFFSNSECHSKYFPFNSINDQQDMLSIMHEKIILLENNQWVIITQFHKFKGAAYVFLFAAIHWWIVISLFIYQFKYITNNLKSTSYTHQWILYGNVYALACHQICHLYIRLPLSLFFSLTLTYTWTKYFFSRAI